MSVADYSWWVDRYEAGGPTEFVLWEDDTRQTELAFTSGYLLRPSYEGITKGHYTGVRIEITNLAPTVT
jgi:hypothetical protein